LEVDDVLQITARMLRSLLRLLLPSAGRHRAANAHRAPMTAPRHPRVPALDGEAIGLVRPYVLAHERRVERERRLRRRAGLVVAPQGVDLPEVVA
jgi:hypothetical protein